MTGNDLAFVRDTMRILDDAGITTWLFGGWAEELLGLTDPRQHHDLDLLCPASDFTAVDGLLTASAQLTEISAKRLGHKRAFLRLGIMTELILVQPASPAHVTVFWDRLRWHWPDDLLTSQVGGLRIASAAAVQQYRANYDHIRAGLLNPRRHS